MRRTPSGWTASCEGEDFEREQLAEALRQAIGHERGESLQLGVEAHETIEAWLEAQAARIEREAGG